VTKDVGSRTSFHPFTRVSDSLPSLNRSTPAEMKRILIALIVQSFWKLATHSLSQRWNQRCLVRVLTYPWGTATAHQRGKMIKLISLKF
jgi:hypothetical protein